jgi:hypothetical protein
MPGLEPISPELALVSPELAAEARSALPDRPWEAFAPPRPPVPAPVESPALRRAELPAAAAAEPPAAERPRRRLVTPSRLVTAAAVGLLVVTGFLPPRNAPRLVAADSVPVARAATARPPRFAAVPPDEPECAAGRSGQRDPFRPVCPPPRQAP